MIDESTPHEVIEGKPQSFLQRMEPGIQRSVIHLTLALLSETRRSYKNTSAVLMGLADMEENLLKMLPDSNPTPQRVVRRSEAPVQSSTI